MRGTMGDNVGGVKDEACKLHVNREGRRHPLLMRMSRKRKRDARSGAWTDVDCRWDKKGERPWYMYLSGGSKGRSKQQTVPAPLLLGQSRGSTRPTVSSPLAQEHQSSSITPHSTRTCPFPPWTQHGFTARRFPTLSSQLHAYHINISQTRKLGNRSSELDPIYTGFFLTFHVCGNRREFGKMISVEDDAVDQPLHGASTTNAGQGGPCADRKAARAMCPCKSEG